MSHPTYHLTLHKTYYEKGFFNIGVDVDRFVSQQASGAIELQIDNGRTRTLQASMTRTANNNGTPRIHGGAALRDWFVENFSQGDTVLVSVLAPTVLKLSKGGACQ